MTVVAINSAFAAPGRLADACGLAARAAELADEHGAIGSRLLIAHLGGDLTHQLVLTREYPDLAAFGAAGDALLADPELLALDDAIAAADSPVVGMRASVLDELPLDRAGDPTPGSIVEMHIDAIAPGGLGALLDLTARVADHVEARGATNARLWRLVAAGSDINKAVFTIEFPSLEAWGRVAEAWLTEPSGLALASEMSGVDACYSELSSAVYGVVPTAQVG